jgi:hypothetical protein
MQSSNTATTEENQRRAQQPPSACEGRASACETYEWCHYTRSSWEYGWGEIAKKDFKVSGAGVELRTNLANATNFYTETCTWDETTWTGSCQTGTAKDSFNLKWTKNGESSSSSNGTSQYTYGKYSYKSTGQSRSASADVKGSAFGAAVDSTGEISRSHTNGIVRDIVPSTKP